MRVLVTGATGFLGRRICSKLRERDVEVDVHGPVWAEAALLTAIHLARRDLGIRTIYCHTPDSHCQLKDLSVLPPRSLYVELPRRFGFRLSKEAPGFLQRDRHPGVRRRLRDPGLRFWALRL